MTDLLTRYGLRPVTPMGLPYVSGEEAMEGLINQFNRLQPQYTTDPATGKTIVRKFMPKPMGPTELDPLYQGLFRSPWNPNWQSLQPNLGASWILPVGAMTEDKFLERTPPIPDVGRQSAYLTGVGGVGPTTTSLNPLTHWPESSFKVGLREPSVENPYASPEPMFGTTVDYSTGRWFAPPVPGAWSQTYGRFPAEAKTSPGWGNVPAISPVVPTEYQRRLRQSLLRRMV